RATVVEHQVPIALIDEAVAAVCGGDRLVGVQYLPGLHVVPLGSGPGWKNRVRVVAGRRGDRGMLVSLRDALVLGGVPRPSEVLDPEHERVARRPRLDIAVETGVAAFRTVNEVRIHP